MIQKQHFHVFKGTLYRCPAHSLQETVYPKPMTRMESRDSERCAFFSSGESVTRHFADTGP